MIDIINLRGEINTSYSSLSNSININIYFTKKDEDGFFSILEIKHGNIKYNKEYFFSIDDLVIFCNEIYNLYLLKTNNCIIYNYDEEIMLYFYKYNDTGDIGMDISINHSIIESNFGEINNDGYIYIKIREIKIEYTYLKHIIDVLKNLISNFKLKK